MSWNSEKWSKPATKEDIEKSKFEYVKENGWMYEDLNFGFNDYPVESDGKFICYSPQFNTLPSLEESKYVKIVFLKSYNYHNSKNLIVGLYAFPEIGNFKRNADCKLFLDYDFGNIKSLPENIIRFNNPLEINDEICSNYAFLPKGKKLGKMGYNYLEYNNVIKLLDLTSRKNPSKQIQTIKYKFLTEARFKF